MVQIQGRDSHIGLKKVKQNFNLSIRNAFPIGRQKQVKGKRMKKLCHGNTTHKDRMIILTFDKVHFRTRTITRDKSTIQ